MKYNPLSHAVIWALLAVAALPYETSAAKGDIYALQSDLHSQGKIIRITPAKVQSTFTGSSSGSHLAFDPSGNLFEAGGNEIIKINPAGTASPFAANNLASCIAVDSSGNVFVSESNTIYMYPASGGPKTAFATGFTSVNDLLFDSRGNLLAVDYNAGAIYRVTPAGVKSTVASGLNGPGGAAIDRDGNLFVLAVNESKIHKIFPDGQKALFASNVSSTGGMVCDDAGALYVIVSPSDTIVKFSPQGARSNFLTGFTDLRDLAIEPPTGLPLNVSSRVGVQTGDNAAIAGVIITGSGEKKIIVRGIGPSLGNVGVAGALQDPTLELYRENGALIAFDDNWRLADQAAKQETGLAPTDDRESAIVLTVSAPTRLTAVLRGKNNTTGIGLVEVYDLDGGRNAQLGNLSTRGFVGTGANVMIGGFIVGGGSNGTGRVIVRALGPSLANFVAGALPDPTLSLRNANGSQIELNDDWKLSPGKSEIEAAGLQPGNDLESTIVATLAAGNYTALVEGFRGATGVGLVEIYNVP